MAPEIGDRPRFSRNSFLGQSPKNVVCPRFSTWFKAAVFALLVLNTGTYLASGTLSEGLDSIAWLTLLALFERETGRAGALHAGTAVSTVHAVRLACAAMIVFAAAGYVREGEWLDAANSGLWIAVVALLELGVRRPALVAARHALFAGAAAALYASLAAVVVVWLWRGEWFDAYDAALWLAAFAIIEMNILRAREPE
jgi:hypothetical protein